MKVVGFCATMNADATLYFSVCKKQESGSLNEGLASCMTQALTAYQSRNKHLPNMILIYRNGLNEGQLGVLREHEVPALKDACSKMRADPEYNPKLVIVVVKKRTNTRFYPKDGPHIFPGMCCDSRFVVKPWGQGYEFYLISHHAKQGTPAPTCYQIAYDESEDNFNASYVQRITWKLAHLYYNNSEPVSLPAPVQYAKKLAFLTAQSTHAAHKANLNGFLFQL